MAAVSKSHRRFVYSVALVYAVFWVAMAIKPNDRGDWMLENVVVIVAIGVLLLGWHWFAFSKTSYVLIGLFLCFHTIGSHYTYSVVPYDAWFEKLGGRTLSDWAGWERNHFDRLVHFLYGLLLTLPYREALLHLGRYKWAFWSYLLPFSLILATSMVYELLEWAAALVFGGDLGVAFLGTQGDQWDAQRDSFLAMVGSLIATLVMVGVHIVAGRDATREWIESQDRDQD